MTKHYIIETLLRLAGKKGLWKRHLALMSWVYDNNRTYETALNSVSHHLTRQGHTKLGQGKWKHKDC